MTAPQSASRKPKQLDAGCFQPEISSFGLHLAAEGKAAKTVRTYTEAVQWFAARLPGQASRVGWEQVGSQDIQRWMAWLLDRYKLADLRSLSLVVLGMAARFLSAVRSTTCTRRAHVSRDRSGGRIFSAVSPCPVSHLHACGGLHGSSKIAGTLARRTASSERT